MALSLLIDNWRWDGVPPYIRAGKELPVKQTEIRVVFRRPPRIGVGDGGHPDPNQLVIRIDPVPGARLRFIAKQAGVDAFEPADLEVLFERTRAPTSSPTSASSTTPCWATAGSSPGRRPWSRRGGSSPLLEEPGPVHPYAPRTWGPEAAAQLPRGVGAWQEPWMP